MGVGDEAVCAGLNRQVEGVEVEAQYQCCLELYEGVGLRARRRHGVESLQSFRRRSRIHRRI